MELHTQLSISLLAEVGGAEAGPTRGFAVAPAAAVALILSLWQVNVSRGDMECATALVAQ